MFLPFLIPAVITVIGIFVFLVVESYPAVQHFGLMSFFKPGAWSPAGSEVSLVPMLAGTFACSLFALVISIPLGVMAAGYIEFFAPPWVATTLSRLVELTAAIPSVVYGVWGLVTLVPLVGKVSAPGTSLVTGTVVLAMMLLPTIVMQVRLEFFHTSRSLRRASVSAGLHPFAAFSKIHLPNAKQGIANAATLSFGRALGETIALMMVTGNVPVLPENVFSSIRTLTANIALEMGYALGEHRSALFMSGFLLMVVVTTVMIGSQVVGGALRRSQK